MYGSSNHNQRIESFWGFLRKECIEFWLEFFHGMKNEGYFDGTFLDVNLVLFCFLGLIQDELDRTADVWNTHIISPSKNENVPHGRPNVMYFVPELYNTKNYTQGITQDDLDECEEECIFRGSIPCDEDVFRLCSFIMAKRHLTLSHDAYSGLELYLVLREVLSVLNE
ncbi:uncharacterized protein LOC117306426 [Asterias rubens]|nr:uncharacterized protein LOC117306426 [Asterias rubens]